MSAWLGWRLLGKRVASLGSSLVSPLFRLHLQIGHHEASFSSTAAPTRPFRIEPRQPHPWAAATPLDLAACPIYWGWWRHRAKTAAPAQTACRCSKNAESRYRSPTDFVTLRQVCRGRRTGCAGFDRENCSWAFSLLSSVKGKGCWTSCPLCSLAWYRQRIAGSSTLCSVWPKCP